MKDTVCIICGQPIRWNGLLWVEIKLCVFPQYCHDDFQNESKSQYHVPKDVE